MDEIRGTWNPMICLFADDYLEIRCDPRGDAIFIKLEHGDAVALEAAMERAEAKQHAYYEKENPF